MKNTIYTLDLKMAESMYTNTSKTCRYFTDLNKYMFLIRNKYSGEKMTSNIVENYM